MKAISFSQRTRSGFTLVELITVISVIVVLFALVAGAYSYADFASKRNRTEVTLRVIRSALENYREKFGSYPTPSNPEESVVIADLVYISGEASCLYQALSGDGYNKISGADGQGSPESNGQVEDNEAANVTLTDMPREIWTVNNSTYFVIDGFGHPFRYIKALPTVSLTGGQPPEPVTINNTYDLWSYGNDNENLTATSLMTRDSATLSQASSKWIKNW
ncbi:MAG: type II secretion system GspH family protein [Prosthecobacter sp.]|jgi:prepilin-type N-terminal cleavage/methylation domain-containing protein|nr:type II secretion system GspH family protein [Prosthecobacter sp.]